MTSQDRSQVEAIAHIAEAGLTPEQWAAMLKFLADNAPQIIALIMAIIAMFQKPAAKA